MMTVEETRQHHAELALQEAASRLVYREVHCCLSTLVATLANATALNFSLATKDVETLAYQAQDLAAPVEDYEEAARQAGYEVRHDMNGYYWCTDAEAEHEDAGAPSVGFDGRYHGATPEEAWSGCCGEYDIEPYQREVFEHWSVSEWLADKLEAEGERIARDFAGLIVWSRTTTGQAISMDDCIRAIARKMLGEPA